MVSLHLRLDLQRGVRRLRKAVADHVTEEAIGRRPREQRGGPAALRVARPGDHAAEAILPRRQQRISLRTLQHDIRGRTRGCRHVTGQGGKRVERNARQDLGQRRQTRRDVAFDDPWLERLVRLLQEDLRHVLDAVALVEASVAPGRDGLHDRCTIPVGADRDRRNGDPMRVDAFDDRLRRPEKRVAVAEHDDVLERSR